MASWSGVSIRSSPPRADYVLTDKGRDLGPILIAMQAWGLKYASPPTIVERSAG